MIDAPKRFTPSGDWMFTLCLLTLLNKTDFDFEKDLHEQSVVSAK
jgi:hypothetical protein